MPSALKYVAPTEPAKRQEFEQQLIAEKAERKSRYIEALKYYKGEHKAQLEILDDGTDDNTSYNLVKVTVDRTADYLFPAVPTISINKVSAEESDEETWVREFLDFNGGLEAMRKIITRGCLAGHNYVRVKPVDPALYSDPSFYPTIIPLDPTSIYTYWAANDVADVLWYEYRFIKDGEFYIEDTVKVDHGRSWIVYLYKSKAGKTDQSLSTPTHHGSVNLFSQDAFSWSNGGAGFELVSATPHTFHIPPIISWPHLIDPDGFYGESEATQIDLQDKINRMVSERSRVIRAYTEPVDVLTGTDVEEIRKEHGLIAIPEASANITRLESKGDLSGLTESLNDAIQHYLSVNRVTVLKGDPKDLQRVTNVGIRLLFKDMESKNAQLKDSYGRGLSKIVRLALAMGVAASTVQKSIQEVKTMKITIKFKNGLPVDYGEVAQTNLQMVGLGTRSLQTAANQMGDDWIIEQANMEAEAKARNLRLSQTDEPEAVEAKSTELINQVPNRLTDT